MMRVEIERTEGLAAFEVPRPDGEAPVMWVLDYIYQNLDPTLAYFSHSACNQGICGRCAVKVNGKTQLACVAKVPQNTEVLQLAPIKGEVVRDLVVKY